MIFHEITARVLFSKSNNTKYRQNYLSRRGECVRRIHGVVVVGRWLRSRVLESICGWYGEVHHRGVYRVRLCIGRRSRGWLRLRVGRKSRGCVTAASDETPRLRVGKRRAKPLATLDAYEQRVPADSSTSERPLYERN